ncbi:tetraspanin-18 [Frankliniella occidentalis]|uniref:Tetraspanin n=1 Tax=Frankliniella occidentalis TaxID=133901 RepID=A0A9C6U6F2_FRAOC|nr:tetraspanin-18 [Frankliniella occidentalis]
MSSDCGSCLAKYVLCLFNFVLFLLGGVVLGVGAWYAADSASIVKLVHTIENTQGQKLPDLTASAYILIAAGAFVFIISFLGYCGAVRESRCLLSTYGVLLVLILIMEVAAGVIAAAYKDQATTETKGLLKATIVKNYTINDNDTVTFVWNHLMAQLRCCGVDGYRDFAEAEQWKGYTQKVVPEACCMLQDPVSDIKPVSSSCVYNPSEANSYMMKGCYQALGDWLNQHINVVIGVGVGLGLVQLFAIFLAFCLVKSINGYFK